MTRQDSIQIFEDKKVRTLWDTERERWFFSVIDVSPARVKILAKDIGHASGI